MKRTVHIGDSVFRNLTRLFALAIFFIVLLMAFEMWRGAQPSIKRFGLGFISGTTWDPVRDVYGALPFIYGTLISSFLALLIAIPLGLGSAIFLSELAPSWLEVPVSFLTELLAAIPSIVYGLWGIFVLIPWLQADVEPFLSKSLGFLPFFKGTPYGFGILAASVVLAVMVLPIIVSISRDVLKSVPNAHREAALALGATRWETIRIVLSGTKSGLLGAGLLGLGRAVGETMAVTMVIGNRPDISASLFDPAYSMASVIANEFTEATSTLYVSSLIEIALLLFGITLVLNVLARLIVWSTTRRFASA
jgi:phosphate transport system permease protein